MGFTIIGASGFIGRHLARHLRARGVPCRTPARNDDSVFDSAHEHVIYCAGYTSDFLASPPDTVGAHVGLLSDLLRRGRFDTLTYLSSTRLYDFAEDGSGREDAVLRLSPHVPRHLFDLSKALGESLCIHSGRAGVRAARLASVYADELDSDGFLHSVLRAARDRTDSLFDVAPSTERDYIHIDDVCALLVAIAENGRRPIYNVASGVNTSNQALFDAIRRLTGVELEATQHQEGQCPSPIIDVAAACDDFGYRPAALLDRLPDLLDPPSVERVSVQRAGDAKACLAIAQPGSGT